MQAHNNNFKMLQRYKECQHNIFNSSLLMEVCVFYRVFAFDIESLPVHLLSLSTYASM